MDGTSASTDGLVAQVRAALLGELSQGRAELDRAKALLGEAVSGLADSFAGLDASTRAQQDRLQAMLEAFSTGLAGGDEAGGLRGFIAEMSGVLRASTRTFEVQQAGNTEAVGRLETLGRDLEAVFAILEQVETISSTTTVLALNAAIEAARAGAAGRGFGVVATELKGLSRFSAQSADEIGRSLERTRVTLSEVAGSILGAVTRTESATRESRTRAEGLLEHLGGLDAVLAQGLDAVGRLTAEIAGRAALAVRSLQFEDLVRQTLESVDARLVRLDSIASALAPVSGAADPPEARIAALRDAWSALPPPPVRQENLCAGAVELF